MNSSPRPFDNYFDGEDDSEEDLEGEEESDGRQPFTQETTPYSRSESPDHEDDPCYSGWKPVDEDPFQESSLESSGSPSPRQSEDSSDDETVGDSVDDEVLEEQLPPASTFSSGTDVDYGEDLKRRILEWHPTIPPEFVSFFQKEAVRLGRELQQHYQKSSVSSSKSLPHPNQ